MLNVEIIHDAYLAVLCNPEKASICNLGFPSYEDEIAKSAYYSFQYAMFVTKKRFQAGESEIARYPGYAYLYAKEILKDRFPEAEHLISKHSEYAYLYAKNVIKGNFLKGEAAIEKNPDLYESYTKFMKKFVPVIHVKNEEQAVRNAKIVNDSGAYGCFLIDHSCNPEHLLNCYRAVKAEFPLMWVGLNFLEDNPMDIYLKCPMDLNALWIDNLRIDENLEVQQEAKNIYQNVPPKVKLFGGVAFKYQKPVTNLAKVAELGAQNCHVVTTSGTATGEAPQVTKIVTMKNAIEDCPLAIASGITLENIQAFLPYVDYFMVATGISKSFTELDPEKVNAMAKIIHK